MAALGGRDIGEDLKFTVGERRQTVDGLTDTPDTRAVSSGL